MTLPNPPHFAHADDVTIWPSRLWRTRCTWPRPLHSLQVTGFVPERGKILPRRMFGTCAEHQRKLTLAIKRARNIALLPFASE